jgi:hypothetical protein
MFCVRVEPSLRRRVKLAAVAGGRTIQQVVVEALEEVCRHHEVSACMQAVARCESLSMPCLAAGQRVYRAAEKGRLAGGRRTREGHHGPCDAVTFGVVSSRVGELARDLSGQRAHALRG